MAILVELVRIGGDDDEANENKSVDRKGCWSLRRAGGANAHRWFYGTADYKISGIFFGAGLVRMSWNQGYAAGDHLHVGYPPNGDLARSERFPRMIELGKEDLLSLAEAARTIPPIDGKRPHISSIWRWINVGIRGVHWST